MADSSLNSFVARGTTTQRLAFTPSIPTPASGPSQGYLWWDTTLQAEYAWDPGTAAWVATGGGSGLNQLTGDVTAGPGTGSQAATIANNAVTTAKINNGAVTEAKQTLADNTTANVSTSAHGYAPKAPSDATKFLNGANPPAWTVPAGGGNTTSTGAAGSEPGSPASGDLYLPDNGFVQERYSGSAWVPWGPIFPLTSPQLQTFTWVNQGSASVGTTKGGLVLRAPSTGSAADVLRLRVKTAPSTPYTITAGLLVGAVGSGGGGLAFRESGSGKVVLLEFYSASGTPKIDVVKFTDATTFSSFYLQNNYVAPQSLIWLRITDNGTNRIVSFSMDGQSWVQIYSVGRTDFLTADQVGFFANAVNANIDAVVTLLSWQES